MITQSKNAPVTAKTCPKVSNPNGPRNNPFRRFVPLTPRFSFIFIGLPIYSDHGRQGCFSGFFSKNALDRVRGVCPADPGEQDELRRGPAADWTAQAAFPAADMDLKRTPRPAGRGVFFSATGNRSARPTGAAALTSMAIPPQSRVADAKPV